MRYAQALHIYTAICRVQLLPCSILTTMKTNCWIGPLIAVILLLSIKQTMYELQSEEQQVAVPAKKAAIEEKKEDIRKDRGEKETIVVIGARLKS